MSKSKSLPSFVQRIRTYDALDQYSHAFGQGHLNLLLLLGGPGLGKSHYLRRRLPVGACFIEGNASPFGIYMAAYEHRDRPLVLDDVDGLYRDRAGIRLLKTLCQSDPIKTVGWHSSAAALQRLGIPQQFQTSSPVAIVGNDWKTLSADVLALEDRGHLVLFDPPPLEVHRYAAGFFWNQEIFDFVAEHLHLIQQHSLRTYVRAAELYEVGIDWKAVILDRCLSGKLLEVAKLKANSAFSSEQERVHEFIRQGHGSRATYFSYARKLLPAAEVPHIVLTTTLSPKQAAKAESVFEMLHHRHGQLGNG